LIKTWTGNIPKNARVRLADISQAPKPERGFWLTPWVNRQKDLLDGCSRLAFHKKSIKRSGNLNRSLVLAINELQSLPCDGPRWLVIISDNTDDLMVNLNDDVAKTLMSSSIRLYVNRLNEEELPKEPYDLLNTAKYSGGSVIAAKNSASLKIVHDLFNSKVWAFANNRYQLRWFDANFSERPSERKYQFAFKHDGASFRYSVPLNPNKAVLNRWREKEWEAALKLIDKGRENDFHKAAAAILKRYPMDSLQDFFHRAHDHAIRLETSKVTHYRPAVLGRLENFFKDSKVWRKIFRDGYNYLGDYFVKQGSPEKAIVYYEKSLNYKEDQTVYEKLLKCQLDILDFRAAQKSAKWIYTFGNLTGRSTQFVQNMAFAYGASLKFTTAEKLIRRNVLKINTDDPIWSYPILTMKGIWFGEAARIISYVMPNINNEKDFDEMAQEFSSFPDVRWVGFSTSMGKILYASEDKFRGKRLDNLYTFLKNLPFLKIRQPIFLNGQVGQNRIGLIIIPVKGASRKGFVLFCFDELLELSERHSLIALRKNPADNEAWNNMKIKIASRCGPAMTKTMGRGFRMMNLSHNNWVSQIIDARQALSSELVAYTIVSGRKTSNSPIEVLLTDPGNLPVRLLQDDNANSNPYFMYIKRKWKQKTAHEFTTAIYLNNQWVGTYRVGYLLW